MRPKLRQIASICICIAIALSINIATDLWVHPRPVHAVSTFAPRACTFTIPVSLTANTQIVAAPNANMFIYICAYQMGTAGTAESASIVEGTGATCGTGTLGVIGGATAATGVPVNTSSLQLGGGIGYVAKTAKAGDNVCILVSSNSQVGGVISYDLDSY